MASKLKLNQVLIAACIAAGAGALSYGIASRSSSGAEPAPIAVAPKPAATANAAKKDAPKLKIPVNHTTTANITVENASGSDVRNELLLPAVVTAVPGAEAAVASCVNGTLVRASHRLGDTVKAGEVLASIESLEAATMASDHRAVQVRVDLVRKTPAYEKSLFDQGVTPRQALEAVQADVDVVEAKAQWAVAVAGAARVGSDGRPLNIVAPIADRITPITALAGAHVMPDLGLFRVGTPDAVQIEAPLIADDLRRVVMGGPATVLTRSGKPVPATVRGLTLGVSATTYAATVVLIPMVGPDAQSFFTGEGVQVRLQTCSQSTPQGVAVSEEAVQNIDGMDVMFLRTPEGFRAQQVYVGLCSGDLA